MEERGLIEAPTIEEVLQVIILRYALEGSINKLVKEYGLNWIAFYDALKKSPILAGRYAIAREARAETLVDEALEIVDTEEDPHRARIRSEMRRWAASKYNARTYGDKLDLTIIEKPSITDALADAKARVIDILPNRNLLT